MPAVKLNDLLGHIFSASALSNSESENTHVQQSLRSFMEFLIEL